MRKNVLILAVLLLVVFFHSGYVSAADIVSSGTCGGNLTWTLDSDGLLTISGSGPMQDYPSFSGNNVNLEIKNVVIDPSVTSIGMNAFKGCSNLTGIMIPDGLVSIGDYAFSGCSSMTSITIPDGVTSIGKYVFSNCSSLSSITIPDGVTSIGENTFNGCSSMTSITIPDGVTSIGDSAFNACSSMTSITIPNSVISIGGRAFNGCIKLTNITIPNGVTSIGDYTFSNCGSLVSMTIPDSVISIGGRAFQSCIKLTSIAIPDSVTNIGDYAFESCSKLTSITIPDGVISIGRGLFYGCRNLTGITIPDDVTSIGEEAFVNCSSITSIMIPDGVTSIGRNAFGSCSSLTNITLPDGLTSIDNNVFSNCSSITSITIPDSVTSIGDYAFTYCRNLTSITIPDGMTSIGDYAFSGCRNLTSITIPDSVTSIGDYAFSGCSSIKDVYFSGTTAEWNQLVGDNIIALPEGVFIHTSDIIASGNCGTNLIWILNGDGLLSINGTGQMWSTDNSPWEDYAASILTAEINSGATSIGDSAFKDCINLTEITLPDSITKIGRYSFWGCSGLESITIPATVTNIDAEAFDGLQQIYGNECSIAHTFAVQHNIAFESIEGDTTKHTYGEPIWRWAEDYNSAQAVFMCTDCGMEYAVDSVITQNGTAATCTIPGGISYIAVAEFNSYFVSDVKTVTIPALGHDWGSPTYTWTVDNRTVTALRQCDRDASHVETEIATVTSKVTKYAGCETKGETTYTANFENEAFETQSKVLVDIDALGHDYGNWITEKEATCKETGLRYQVCSRCGDRIEEQLPMTEHICGEMTIITEATCEADGTQGFVCAVCGTIVDQETIPKYGHDYGGWIIEKEATCKETGLRYQVCSRCGDIVYEYLQPYGHNFGECTYYDESQHSHTCLRCQTVEYEDHDFSTGACICGADATGAVVCDKMRVSTEFLPEEAKIIAGAYDENGRMLETHFVPKEQSASVDFKFARILEAARIKVFYVDGEYRPLRAATEVSHEVGTGHTYVAEVTKEPTCTKEGLRTYTCSVCGESYTEAIPKAEHTAVIDPGIDATCTERGLTEGTHCSVCGVVLQAQTAIPALGHTAATEKGYAATCEHEGLSDGKYCSVCGQILKPQTVIPALGHNYVNSRCSRCGKSEAFDALAQIILNKGTRQSDGTCSYIYTTPLGVTYLYIYDPDMNTIKLSYTDTTAEATSDFTMTADLSSPYIAHFNIWVGTRYMGISSYLYPATFAKNTTTIGYYSKTTGLSDASAAASAETLATSIKHMLLSTDILYSENIIELGNRQFNVYNLGFVKFDNAPGTSVTSVSLNATSITLTAGGTRTLTATVYPSTASGYTVTWRSSNSNVASVSSSGLVTAKSDGTATITATAGGKSATCTVTVQPSAAALSTFQYLINYTKRNGELSNGNYFYSYSGSNDNMLVSLSYMPDDEMVVISYGSMSSSGTLHSSSLFLENGLPKPYVSSYTIKDSSGSRMTGYAYVDPYSFSGSSTLSFASWDGPNSLQSDAENALSSSLAYAIYSIELNVLRNTGHSIADLGFTSMP